MSKLCRRGQYTVGGAEHERSLNCHNKSTAILDVRVAAGFVNSSWRDNLHRMRNRDWQMDGRTDGTGGNAPIDRPLQRDGAISGAMRWRNPLKDLTTRSVFRQFMFKLCCILLI